MGYYTNFHVTIFHLDSGHGVDDLSVINWESLPSYIAENIKDDQVWEDKWYGVNDDMITLSKANPDFVFEVSGNGEVNTDIWKSWYVNGQEATWNLAVEVPSWHKYQAASTMIVQERARRKEQS